VLREAVDGFFAGVSARFETITGPIKAMASGVLEPAKLFENLLEKGLEWVLNLLITKGPSATLSAALRGVQKLLGAGKTIAGELMNLTIAGEPVGQMLVGMITPAIKALPVFSEISSLAIAAGGFLAELAGGLQSQLGELRSAVSAELSSGATFLANFLGITLPREQGADPKKTVQRSAKADDGGAMAVDGTAERSLASSSGRPLETGVRARMEESFGRDFSSVRVHTDGHADAASSGLRAHALTQGSSIYFASGSYQPGTRQGDELLAHELTHVVQQNAAPALGGAKQTPIASSAAVRAKRATSAASDAAEQQADRVGRGIAAGDPTAAREVSPHLAADRTLHRSAAKVLKDRFKTRFLSFGQAVKGWDAAVTRATRGNESDILGFAHTFTNSDQSAAFVGPLGADPFGFLAALQASLRIGKLPADVENAVSVAINTIEKAKPTVDKEAVRMEEKVWAAFQYVYGIATLALVASDKRRDEVGPTSKKRDLTDVKGFSQACTMVKKSSKTANDTLFVFYTKVPGDKATLSGGNVTISKTTAKATVDRTLRAAVQKGADDRYTLMKSQWLKAVGDYSKANEGVLDSVAAGWNPKTVGDDKLKVVSATAQQAANWRVPSAEVEERLQVKHGPKALGMTLLKPMAGDLIGRVKENIKSDDRETTRWDTGKKDELVGRFSIAEGDAKADLKLMSLVDSASVGDEQGIVAFMLIMARDGKVTNGKTTLTFEQFNDATLKHPMSWHISVNRTWVKNRFREAMDNTHEWIPSNMIVDVIERGVDSRDRGNNPAKWIGCGSFASRKNGSNIDRLGHASSSRRARCGGERRPGACDARSTRNAGVVAPRSRRACQATGSSCRLHARRRGARRPKSA
jgi:hypothetical protein